MAEARPLQGRFVVDTNILAYYVLGTEPFNEELDGVFSMPLELIAPDSWQEESFERTLAGQPFSDNLSNWTVPVGSLWREALVAVEQVSRDRQAARTGVSRVSCRVDSSNSILPVEISQNCLYS